MAGVSDRDILDRAVEAEAGIVHEHVNAAELGFDRRDCGGDAVFL